MRKQLLISIAVGSVTFAIVACNNDTPTSTRRPGVPSNDITAASSNACVPNPSGRPGRIVDTVTTPSPWGVAVRDDGLTYFTEVFNGGVGVTSTRTRTIDAFIPTGQIPTGIAFSPDGSTAYVANQFGDVSVLDVATQANVASIAIPNPLAVRVSPDGTQLFVATGGTSVYIVDIASRQVTKTVQVGFAPNGFAVDPDGRILYVSSFLGGSVTEIDMFTGTALRTFFVGGVPQELATNRRGTHLYVANEAGYLNDIDLVSGQLAQPIPLQGGGFGLGVTPDDGEAYVTIPNAGVVQVFSLQTATLSATLNVGGNPRRVAFSQQGHIGAITNASGYISFVR
jgi:YVTN family beta-propeller protein